ncbi:hypothetical protein ES703_108670 [subsurface metagenome]
MTAIIEWFKALQGIDWVLVGAIVLLFVGYLYILLWIIPSLEFVGGRVGRRKIQVFGILFGSLVVFYLFYSLHSILPNEWVEISLLAGLVAATSGLAVYAAGQAYASVKMAREMREQRLSEAQPYLLIRLADEVVQWESTKEGERRPTEFPVTIRNVGKGPAINLWAAMWGPMKVYAGDSKGYLAPDEEWQTSISRLDTGGVRLGFYKEGWLPELVEIVKQDKPGIIAVKYQDVHKRSWATYLVLERNVDVPEYVMEDKQDIVEVEKQ